MTLPPLPAGRVWRFGNRCYDLSRRPLVMGILNVTPDSFSDGGRFDSPESAVDRALAMVAEGADIIDIGGESTRPNVSPVSAAAELRRVVPIVEKLAPLVSVPLSIDTYKAVVARETIAVGAEIINDVSGFTFDDDMAGTVASSTAGVVLMHTRGRPTEMQRDTVYTDLVSEVAGCLAELVARTEASGIGRERIVVDPGIGFGKSVAGNLELLRRLGDLTGTGCPLLVGTSRKSFIGTQLGRDVDERLFGTAATVAVSIMNGARIVRVHDVRAMRDVVDMTWAIMGGGEVA
ncbi:dihydropteroate synthase [Geobacter argillaceus]|uniref:Dihydropteroate synthase n=1 Tax=Geobacter argillaceus TaxID=345631 RepID=A0A562W961_9BACT|nr:dihydropteroate synthase [Geobacter argillaceus]TWJ26497.1 dihydropteroate synthase [Geobacter argillaceus]